jgi:putative transposase
VEQRQRCQGLRAQDLCAKLKKLLAEAMLDNAMLKEIAAKKW